MERLTFETNTFSISSSLPFFYPLPRCSGTRHSFGHWVSSTYCELLYLHLRLALPPRREATVVCLSGSPCHASSASCARWGFFMFGRTPTPSPIRCRRWRILLWLPSTSAVSSRWPMGAYGGRVCVRSVCACVCVWCVNMCAYRYVREQACVSLPGGGRVVGDVCVCACV